MYALWILVKTELFSEKTSIKSVYLLSYEGDQVYIYIYIARFCILLNKSLFNNWRNIYLWHIDGIDMNLNLSGNKSNLCVLKRVLYGTEVANHRCSTFVNIITSTL